MGANRAVTTIAPVADARSARSIRAALLIALVFSAAGPIALLATWSVSGDWFFPALLPRTMTLAAWRSPLGEHRLVSAFGTSVTIAIATSVIACALGLPLGRLLANLQGWRRHVAAAAAFLPVAAPPLALGTGLQLVAFGTGLAGTDAGVLIAHLIPAIAYLSLLFLGTFTLFDVRPAEAARTLGASPSQVWRRVVIPQLRIPIVEALVIGFLVSWTQFALTLVVGAGAVRTLPLEVFAFVRAGEDRAAAAGALLLIIPPAVAFVSLRRAARLTSALSS